MKCGVGTATFLMLVAALVAPADFSMADTSGAWSDAVQVSETAVWAMEFSDDAIFAYGRDTCVVSEDAGDTWGPERQFNGRVDFEDGVVYRASMSEWPDYGDTVQFSKSTDLGVTWSPTVDVITLNGWNDYAFGIHLLGPDLFICTYDSAGTDDGQIMVAKSTDHGATWNDQVVVDPTVHVEDPWAADMVLWDGKVYIVYWNYSYETPEFDHVVLIESSDMGDTWTNRQVVAEGVLPSIRAQEDALYITYIGMGDSSSMGIYFTKSTDGLTWSTPTLVSPLVNLSDSATWHVLDAHGDDIFVGYTVITNGEEDTYSAHINHSADGGITWTDMGDVTGGTGDEILSSLATTNDRLHMLWRVPEGSWDDTTVYYRYLTIDPLDDTGPGTLPLMIALVCVVAVVAIGALFVIRRKKVR